MGKTKRKNGSVWGRSGIIGPIMEKNLKIILFCCWRIII
jgi:hypothetical protein